MCLSSLCHLSLTPPTCVAIFVDTRRVYSGSPISTANLYPQLGLDSNRILDAARKQHCRNAGRRGRHNVKFSGTSLTQLNFPAWALGMTKLVRVMRNSFVPTLAGPDFEFQMLMRIIVFDSPSMRSHYSSLLPLPTYRSTPRLRLRMRSVWVPGERLARLSRT
jgi:hypothetical protein